MKNTNSPLLGFHKDCGGNVRLKTFTKRYVNVAGEKVAYSYDAAWCNRCRTFKVPPEEIVTEQFAFVRQSSVGVKLKTKGQAVDKWDEVQ